MHTPIYIYIYATTSQILTIRRILDGVWAKNLQARIPFIDFTKAFASIHRGKRKKFCYHTAYHKRPSQP